MKYFDAIRLRRRCMSVLIDRIVSCRDNHVLMDVVAIGMRVQLSAGDARRHQCRNHKQPAQTTDRSLDQSKQALADLAKHPRRMPDKG